jgi:protein phosphatase PTC7
LEPLPKESGPLLKIDTGAAYIPNPQKANKLGEDAHFIAKDGKSFGVADGVGGWALSGVDAGEYSRLLMQMAQLFAESKKLDPHPKQVLWAAYKQTEVRGSSTACLLKLKADILHACNVGDSGFMIVRDEDVAFVSPHQQHSFNFPYQLGRQEVDAASETPARAQIFAIQLQPEDIIIAGTDGLFDNVFPEESAALMRHARARGESAEAAAKTLADYTFKKAADGRHMSPFAYAAQANGHRFVGGKMDDITVVVSFISEAAGDSLNSSENGSSSSSADCDGQLPELKPPPSKL